MPKNTTKRTTKSTEEQAKKPRPNVDKVCSFWELPKLLHDPLLKKFDAVSMTRMRRTNKALNMLVEKETSLRARSEHKLVIQIELNLEKYVLSFLTTQGEFCDMSELIYFDPDDIYDTCNFTKIKNPLKQLGGVHFKFIVVVFFRRQFYDASYLGYWRLFERKVMPILKELRLHCDVLVFHDTDDCDVSPVIPLIRFNSLIFEECKIDSSKMNWTIENGNVLSIKESLEPQDLKAAFGAIAQFKDVSFSVYLYENALKEIVKAIHGLPLGKLEVLQVHDGDTLYVYDNNDEEEELEDEDDGQEDDPRNIGLLPMVRTLRSRDSTGRRARHEFYKMQISNGGYAITSKSWFDVSSNTSDVNFYIFAEYSREKLFEAFYHRYFEERNVEEVLNSPHYRHFLEAETDEIAINEACENYEKLRQWKDEEKKKQTEVSNVSKE